MSDAGTAMNRKEVIRRKADKKWKAFHGGVTVNTDTANLTVP